MKMPDNALTFWHVLCHRMRHEVDFTKMKISGFQHKNFILTCSEIFKELRFDHPWTAVDIILMMCRAQLHLSVDSSFGFHCRFFSHVII